MHRLRHSGYPRNQVCPARRGMTTARSGTGILLCSKKMKRLFLIASFALAPTANAIVIRADTDDSKYQVPACTFPALADMPGEGHGVLISPRWVATAAHVVASISVDEVTIGGVARPVRQVIFHPGYKPVPDAIIKATLTSGDPTEVMAFLATSDDIALIELASSISDIQPAVLYRGDDELGRKVRLLGKGATGSGDAGESPLSEHRTTLRCAQNAITAADERWISYTFDAPDAALPFEGMTGSGDSGSPILIEREGRWEVAGLASWRYIKGDIHRPGRYGDGGYNVRISRYVRWIENTTSVGSEPPPPPERPNY